MFANCVSVTPAPMALVLETPPVTILLRVSKWAIVKTRIKTHLSSSSA